MVLLELMTPISASLDNHILSRTHTFSAWLLDFFMTWQHMGPIGQCNGIQSCAGSCNSIPTLFLTPSWGEKTGLPLNSVLQDYITPVYQSQRMDLTLNDLHACLQEGGRPGLGVRATVSPTSSQEVEDSRAKRSSSLNSRHSM